MVIGHLLGHHNSVTVVVTSTYPYAMFDRPKFPIGTMLNLATGELSLNTDKFLYSDQREPTGAFSVVLNRISR
jgi:hypothetical protein